MNTDDEVRRLRALVEELREAVKRRGTPLLLPSGMRLMFVTDRVTPRVGDVYGAGRAVGAARDRDAGTIDAGDGGPEDVLNFHLTGFEVGGLIAVSEWDGAGWAHDVDDCGNYR